MVLASVKGSKIVGLIYYSLNTTTT